MAALETAHESLKKSYTSAVKIFANLVELREGIGPGHSRRVAEQARSLALKLGMPASDVQDVVFAALLHDIGKISLADRILNKPFHALEQTERLEFIKHPLVGEAILMSLEPLQGAARIIRCHHEQYDGKGYPEGLRGDEVPLGARVLAVVNDFDALQHGLLWTQRMSAQEAKDYISKNSAKRYDPKVVSAFLPECETVSNVKQDKIAALKSNAVRPGMVLARDILTKDGVLLLSKGHELDERIIRRIHSIERALDHEFTLYIEQKISA
jgi:putative nucleotidyltransferase with HDIG domain